MSMMRRAKVNNVGFTASVAVSVISRRGRGILIASVRSVRGRHHAARQ